MSWLIGFVINLVSFSWTIFILFPRIVVISSCEGKSYWGIESALQLRLVKLMWTFEKVDFRPSLHPSNYFLSPSLYMQFIQFELLFSSSTFSGIDCKVQVDVWKNRCWFNLHHAIMQILLSWALSKREQWFNTFPSTPIVDLREGAVSALTFYINWQI